MKIVKTGQHLAKIGTKCNSLLFGPSCISVWEFAV